MWLSPVKEHGNSTKDLKIRNNLFGKTADQMEKGAHVI